MLKKGMSKILKKNLEIEYFYSILFHFLPILLPPTNYKFNQFFKIKNYERKNLLIFGYDDYGWK